MYQPFSLASLKAVSLVNSEVQHVLDQDSLTFVIITHAHMWPAKCTLTCELAH